MPVLLQSLYKFRFEYAQQRFDCCSVCFCVIPREDTELNEVIHLKAKGKYSETLVHHFRWDSSEETVNLGK
jgi:hypothetical protein